MANDKPHLHVTFYTDTQENPAKSREAGRPIFDEIEMVKILIAGDPKSTIVAPAHSQSRRDPETGQPLTYAERFPEHYRYFKDNKDQAELGGTPLTEVPWITAARREELKALKVFTVEAIAALDGTLLQRLGMDGRTLKAKAEAWLAAASGSAVETKLAEENAAMRGQIEELQRQVAALANGQLPPPAVSEPPQADLDTGTQSPFENWDDADLKNWIADASGQRPQGNPSHKTLVARADEINAQMAERNKAA